MTTQTVKQAEEVLLSKCVAFLRQPAVLFVTGEARAFADAWARKRKAEADMREAFDAYLVAKSQASK